MQIIESILRSQLIVIIRSRQRSDIGAVADALIAGGVTTLEVTLNTPGALAAIELLSGKAVPGLTVGAGTVLCADDVCAAVQAGARFIVTPTLQLDSIEACRRHGMPIICGCASPTEMIQAQNAGADFIKLFPATRFGAAYVRAVLETMPMLRIAPTGGVSVENVGGWLSAGAAAVAVGSSLVDPKLLADNDYAALSARAREFVNAIHRHKAAGSG